MDRIQRFLETQKKHPVSYVFLIAFAVVWALVLYWNLADGLNGIGKVIGSSLAK
ncbi:hypothetical protein [uncultured Draconibacterium sp.]|uniref:hypothetical protein n=1 Tax=uncultured Draconibacterium sp. TaxID=1573823 RepID=UPI00321638CC